MERKKLLDLFIIGWYIGSAIYAYILIFFDWSGPRNPVSPYYFEQVLLYLFEGFYISIWFGVILMIRQLKWQIEGWKVEDHKKLHYTFIFTLLIMIIACGIVVFWLPRSWPSMLIRRIVAYTAWTFTGFLAMYIYMGILNVENK